MDRRNRRRTGSGLLEHTVFKEQDQDFKQTSLNKLLSEVCDSLAMAITESNANIVIDELPTLNIAEHMFFRLFLKFIANSLKYKRPERTPEIHDSATRQESDC